MAFAVEDFQDLLRLLDAHPEWQAQLRQRVLTEGFVGVPDRLARAEAALERVAASLQTAAAAQAGSEARLDARMQALAAAQADSEARWDARMQALAAAQADSEARLDARMEELAAAQARLDARMEELAAAQARTEARMEELAAAQARTESRVGSLRGHLLEYWFHEKGAAALLRVGLKRARVMEVNDWIADVDEAVDRGAVSLEERQDLLHVDTVVWGRDGVGDVHVAVEVSATVDINDVRRASRRAGILGRAYGRARPAVAGYRLTEGAEEAIAESGDILVVTRTEPA